MREAIASGEIVATTTKTRKWFVASLTRLYEQGAHPERIGDYVRHWQRWAVSGLGDYGKSISDFIPDACGAIA